MPATNAKLRRNDTTPTGVRCYISHSPKDGAVYAQSLARELAAHGVITSMNYIQGGERWADQLQSEMQKCQVQILVGSPHALTSDWVRSEIAFFQNMRRRTLPIFFPSARERVPLTLQTMQYLLEEDIQLERGPSIRSMHQIFTVLDSLRASALPIEPVLEARVSKKLPLNEGKLILVGRGEVGKTSLVKRLMGKRFRGDESKTQGINISRWPVSRGAESLRLNVWDFGGQEIMHATHQFFLTERSIYVVVLNGRGGGEDLDAEYWLKHILAFGGESPVVIAQNKIGQHPFDLNYRGLQTRFPQIKGFIKTDCKENVGITELRKLLGDLAQQMPEVRMKIPAEWFRVKEHLEQMKDNFVSYDEFRHICSSEGIDIESERDTLGFALHCLGIALNFKDDSRLRETSVLKPEWLTQGIYKILNAAPIAEQKGELQLSQLKKYSRRSLTPLKSICSCWN